MMLNSLKTLSQYANYVINEVGCFLGLIPFSERIKFFRNVTFFSKQDVQELNKKDTAFFQWPCHVTAN